MLRWTMPFLVAIFAVGNAAAAEDPAAPKAADGPAAAKPADPPAAATPADSPAAAKPADSPAPANQAATKRVDKSAAGKRAAVRAASQLPPGLPRAHYNYRTTVAPAAAPLYVRRGRALVVEEESPGVLLVPIDVAAYAPRLFNAPLLPGSATLPGYYGTSHSYSYDGPYYGGRYEPYWNRLPYACGVYGYC